MQEEKNLVSPEQSEGTERQPDFGASNGKRQMNIRFGNYSGLQQASGRIN